MNWDVVLPRVKEKAHYAIAIRPRSPRNMSFGDLEGLLDYCAVRCRGWPYPYMPWKNGGVRRLEGCIEACHEAGLHADAWRFCKSGRFEEYLGLYEERWPADESESVSPDTPLRERFLEPFVTLYQISEVFLFASNLAGRIDDVWKVAVSLRGMRDRMLDIRVPERFGLYTDYVCRLPAIDLSVELDSWSLQARYEDLAVEKTMEVVGHFGWRGNGIESILRDEQERLYRRSETRSMPGICA